jgi:hypothetical protein
MIADYRIAFGRRSITAGDGFAKSEAVGFKWLARKIEN